MSKKHKEMKKTIAILAVMMMALPMNASTDNDRPIKIAEMPAASREFIATYFPSETVALAKEEREFHGSEYEVVFTSGTKLEFGRDGSWKKISCRYSSVPDGIVPEELRRKIGELYPSARTIGIEKDRRTIEIKLDNRMELTFDRNGELIDIDD